MHALLIDLDGVVYEGDQCVRGAAEALAWLEQQRVPRLPDEHDLSTALVAGGQALEHGHRG